jgi:hypothetical protein
VDLKTTYARGSQELIRGVDYVTPKEKDMNGQWGSFL